MPGSSPTVASSMSRTLGSWTRGAGEFQPAAVATAQGAGRRVRAFASSSRSSSASIRSPRRRRDMPWQPRAEAQVRAHREIEVQGGLLEHDPDAGERSRRRVPHVVAEHVDRSGVGDEQTAQDLEQGGLAGAVRSEQSDELAAPRR